MSSAPTPPLAVKVRLGGYTFVVDSEGLRAVAKLAARAAESLEAGNALPDFQLGLAPGASLERSS